MRIRGSTAGKDEEVSSVHVEPLSALAEQVRRTLQNGQRLCVATVVESHLPELPQGTAWTVSDEDVRCYWPGGLPAPAPGAFAPPPQLGALQQSVAAYAGRLLQQARQRPPGRVPPARERMGHLWWPPDAPPAGPGAVRLFVELLEPPPRLIVLGAGQDAQPLCRIGAEAGFEVRVADPRPAFAHPQRFPQAREVLCVEPDELPREWFAGDCYAVVVHHHFLRDAAALRRLVQMPVAYIGVLGPRTRTERLIARVQQEMGRSLTPQELGRIYSPVGLDIGGEGPGAIALGVVAEIMAIRYGRPAPHLRDRRGPLHPDRLESVPPPGLSQRV